MDVVSNSKEQMSGVLLKRADTGEEFVLDAKGLFYGIGHSPNSQILEGQIELDSSGYIFVTDGASKTSVEGVFAAGDVQVTFSNFFLLPQNLLLTFMLIFLSFGSLSFVKRCGDYLLGKFPL